MIKKITIALLVMALTIITLIAGGLLFWILGLLFCYAFNINHTFTLIQGFTIYFTILAISSFWWRKKNG